MTSQIDVRPCTSADWPDILEVFGSSFGFVFSDESRDGLIPQLDPARAFVATQNGAAVGTAASFLFEMTVPGGTLPTAGVTLVGVRPSHRRRGILRALMRAQLDAVHATGEPLALLWASEAGIYQRFGYGLGTLRGTVELARGWQGFLDDPGPVGQARLVGVDDAAALMPEIYERARPAFPGALVRPRAWWDARILSDPVWRRGGGSEMFRAVVEIDGRPEAYALYRFHGSWGADGLPTQVVEVVEALGTSPTATREVWRFLFGIDIVTAVRAGRLPANHPLLMMLADPRRLRLRVFDGVWLRVVDAAAALAGRTYGAEDTLTVELSDPVCPWNAGHWQLVTGPNGAQVRSTDAPPDLRLGAGALAAMYLGTVRCTSLARAGRVEEVTPGASARADALFRTEAPAWCLDDF